MNARYGVSAVTLLVIAYSLCAAACSDPSQVERVPVVQLAEDSASISVGDTLRLTLLAMLPPGYVPSVAWSSSSPVTATVVRTGALGGTVRGISPGQAVITVSGGGTSDSAVVVVTAPGGGQIPW